MGIFCNEGVILGSIDPFSFLFGVTELPLLYPVLHDSVEPSSTSSWVWDYSSIEVTRWYHIFGDRDNINLQNYKNSWQKKDKI